MKKLRRIRAEKGLTMDALEERTGVSKRTISEIERGMRTPQTLTLAKLANALDVNLHDLLEDEGPKGTAPHSSKPEKVSDEERRARVEDLAALVRRRAGEIERKIEEKIPDPDSSQTYDGEEVNRLSKAWNVERRVYKEYSMLLGPIAGDEAMMLHGALAQLGQVLEVGKARDKARGGAWDRAAAGLEAKQPAWRVATVRTAGPGIGGE